MIIIDIFRHTFPKGLRFDTQCRMLYANLYVVVKRNKHKRYIPKEELNAVLDGYVYPTPPPVQALRVRFIRHLCFLRQINLLRQLFKRRLWLITPAVEVEYVKAKKWLDNEAQRKEGLKRMADFIERERFQSDVMDKFHVATMYHRSVRLGLVVLTCLMIALIMHAWSEYCLYLYLRYWRTLSREEVMEFMRESTLGHLSYTVPPGYESLLPAPAVIVRKGECTPPTAILMDSAELQRSGQPSGGSSWEETDRIYLTVCEFVSPDRSKSVIVLPVPLCGTRAFFTNIGRLLRTCDGILVEGASHSMVSQLPPTLFFPCHRDTFEAARLQHRYMAILGTNIEPPQLLHAAAPSSLLHRLRQLLTPMAIRSVYFPLSSASSKAETKDAWGFIKEVLDNPTTMLSASNIDPSAENSGKVKPLNRESYTLAVPWTAAHLVSLEASLLKLGYVLGSYKHVEWLPLDYIGNSFCDRFQYPA
jgi:hypothetical protein